MTGLAPFILRDHGAITLVMAPEPDLAAGNAQFFDPDPACLIQLRPLLKAEYGEWGQGRGGNAMLYARSDDPSEIDFACFLRVPAQLRKNTRTGVMEAIRRLEWNDPVAAARLRRIAARTRWPRPKPR